MHRRDQSASVISMLRIKTANSIRLVVEINSLLLSALKLIYFTGIIC